MLESGESVCCLFVSRFYAHNFVLIELLDPLDLSNRLRASLISIFGLINDPRFPKSIPPNGWICLQKIIFDSGLCGDGFWTFWGIYKMKNANWGSSEPFK